MHLAFCRAGPDCAPRNEVGRVLRRNGVEKLAARGQPEFGNVEQQGARNAQAFVNLKGSVEVWVVNEALSCRERCVSCSRAAACLPAHGRARLLEINAHHNEQVIFCGVSVLL